MLGYSMVDESHHLLMEALRSRTYERLQVKRYGDRCCLILQIGGRGRTFVNRFGECVWYRHAWQVRDWLRDTFAIPTNEVEVDVVQ